jgi:transposase-like protein
MTDKFDFNQAIEKLKSGKGLLGEDGILTPLIKQLTEAALQSEMEQHLSKKTNPNRRNGYGNKTVKSSVGAFELETPRDRDGSFEPQIVKKNQTKLTDELDQKILSMFASGMSYKDIRSHVEEIYAVDVPEATISAVTDRLTVELKQWQERALDAVYAVVWLDAIFYKVKENGRYTQKTIYTILGLSLEGKKEVLGLYISETEGANYWLAVLTELQNRGVKDILIACVDGLSGFPQAINSIYPNTEVQLCIVHKIRSSIKYIASKNQKEFMQDLKKVYQAINKNSAEYALDSLEEKWGKKYPAVLKSWRNKWEYLSAYFKYPEHIRRIIYTTNTVEAVHRQFRKLTKTKGAFPNENSLLKLLYAGILNISKKWTMPIQNWGLALSQLAIHFEDRLDDYLNI